MHVNLFDFALKNVLRDFKTYSFYFLNCIFSVVIFFLFSVLSFHPSLKIIDEHSSLGLILMVSEFLSISFSLIFIIYSVSKFLKARSRQFGLISIIGCSKKQLNLLIFWENLIIGFLSIISGIILGLIFSKLFLTVAATLIRGVEFNFYIPWKAICLTTLVLGIIFMLISFLTPKFIRKQKIINLIKQEDKPENANIIKYVTILFIALLPLSIFFHKYIDYLGFIVFVSAICDLILLISLTYIILHEFIHMIISISKKIGSYYKNTNMISFSNIKDTQNSTTQAMTLCTVLYMIALLSIIFMTASAGNVEAHTRKIVPQAFLYMPWTEDAPVNKDLKNIENELKKLPGYKKLEYKLYTTEDNSRQAIIPESEYNKISAFLNYDKINLNLGQVYLLSGNVKQKITAIPEYTNTVISPHLSSLEIKGSSQKLIALSGLFTSITVLSDQEFQKVYEESYPNLITKKLYSYDLENWKDYSVIANKLNDKLKNTLDSRKATFISAPLYYENDRLTKNLILYVGSIMCFSFLLAIASFIYSKLYSNIEKDCEKYKNIVKLGLSKKELFTILSSNLKLIMFTPFILAIIYMWIGVIFVEKYVIISNIPITAKYTLIYTFIQIIMYMFIKKSYQKNIAKGVYIN